jgi:RES domain
MLPVAEIDQRNTHRLIPARFADEGASVLTRLTEDEELLDGIFELDNATNDRLIAESGNAPGIDVRELVFGIPQYRIINASFCHPAPGGSRFNSGDRGAWYAGFELETSQAEVAYHMQISLRETAWEREEITDYVDYLADFRAEFHDLRGSGEHRETLDPESYRASQALAAELMELGSAGIVYPCVRRVGGTCLVCFRPVLVGNVRKENTYEFVFAGYEGVPRIRRI